LNGNALNVIIVPLGVLALSIWAFASGLHYFHGKDLTRLARKKLAADGE